MPGEAGGIVASRCRAARRDCVWRCIDETSLRHCDSQSRNLSATNGAETPLSLVRESSFKAKARQELAPNAGGCDGVAWALARCIASLSRGPSREHLCSSFLGVPWRMMRPQYQVLVRHHNVTTILPVSTGFRLLDIVLTREAGAAVRMRRQQFPSNHQKYPARPRRVGRVIRSSVHNQTRCRRRER